MSRHLLLVLTNPVDGREDDYNDWYENVHLDEVLQTEGIEAAQRYELTATVGSDSDHRYLAVYEVDAESTEAAIAALNATRPNRQQSDAIDLRGGVIWGFTAIGERHVSE